MDLDLLKERFRTKAEADVRDIDLVMKATPFLVREVIRLEEELQRSEAELVHLKAQFGKKAPTVRRGRKNQAVWQVGIDEHHNRLLIRVEGVLDKSSAKSFSNMILLVAKQLRADFDVITDMRKLTFTADNRIRFHFRKTFYSLQQMQMRRSIRVVDETGRVPAFLIEDVKQFGAAPGSIHLARSLKEACFILDNFQRHLKQ